MIAYSFLAPKVPAFLQNAHGSFFIYSSRNLKSAPAYSSTSNRSVISNTQNGHIKPVLLAYGRLHNPDCAVVSRPIVLGDIRGVSYIYSIFNRFGLIDVPEKAEERMRK